MQELTTKFERVFVHHDSRDSALAQRLESLFPQEKIEYVSEKPLMHLEGDLSAREFSRSKRLLYICEFKGQFFKRCPGSRPGLACCNYFVLNWGVQCDMNCSYCYLQSFVNTPVLTVYSNLAHAFRELRAMGLGEQNLRIGTGETVDSLSLDPLTLYSHELIAFFRDFPKWTLEFKTKSAAVDQFLDVAHAGNVIASWSVNPQYVIEREEHGTASLAARLAAAQKCRERGFQIAFHIDPMIWHPEWKANYALLVEEIASKFSPNDVPYMSVGALRFQPEQRQIMRERFGFDSLVTTAETHIGRDGKCRYDAKMREAMFQFVLNEFAQRDPRWKIFMCMETPEVWLKAAGQSPFQSKDLQPLFDTRPLRAAHSVRTDSP